MDGSLFHSEPAPTPRDAAWVGFAQVVVNRSLDQAEGLTYGIPESMKDVDAGELVRVPLGRGGRTVEGVVVLVRDAPPPSVPLERLKGIESRLGSGYPPALIELGAWIARYYCCPIGMVLTTMTPASVRRGTGRRETVALDASGAEPTKLLKGRTREVWDSLTDLLKNDRITLPIDADRLQDALGETTKRSINRFLRDGLLKEVTRSSVRAREIQHSPAALPELAAPSITPTDDQARAVEAVISALGTFNPFLLFGVTGSGKTEVYLRVLAEVIERRQSGIVLVPEISLTPQTVSRFVERFGRESVAVLHSGLTGAQRTKEWTRIASGGARVVVGARSAVFAPFAAGTVGVVIVDEEHDTSYKQDQLPRYHARDVAIKRAHLEGCPIVLGSATPSLESWHNARRTDAAKPFRLLRLASRVGGGRLPRVEIVDLTEERRVAREHEKQTGEAHSFALGPTLRRALSKTLEKGSQAMLLLNRRGFASYCCCSDVSCGWVLTCESCDSSMVYHRAGAAGSEDRGLPKGFVRCHHCLAQQKLPSACPSCSKKTIALGAGTQRVEEDLRRLYPRLAQDGIMARVDSDVMNTSSDYFRVLEDFRTGRTRLLLGTQMIAKGLDFPGVELIGVVNADTSLAMPDFRASERTYQLVSQVAGRAGRSVETGATSRVIVQTMNPHERAIRFAANHDFEGFATSELRTREIARFPPVRRMARIVTRDEDAQKAEARIFELFHAINHLEMDRDELALLGPGACALSRLSGQYRFSLELIARDAPTIQRVLAHLRSNKLAISDSKTAIDVDPVSLL